MSTAAPAEPAKTPAERALAAVPVVLTVMATILAGLSSSEMTQSMYYRSLAAQHQAKAGSQWAFFQAKRTRGTMMEGNANLIRVLADVPPLDLRRLDDSVQRLGILTDQPEAPPEPAKAVQRLKEALGRDSVRKSLGYLIGPDLPVVPKPESLGDQLRALMKAIEARQTETQTSDLVTNVPANRIEIALEISESNAAAFEEACEPITADVRSIEKCLSDVAKETQQWRSLATTAERRNAGDNADNAVKTLTTAVLAAKQQFTARRYAKEAAYNQESAELYEILVRRTGAESDRHRIRSRNFFYAMLCAQAGVTIAAFALARSRKSWFWAVAGLAGVLAVSLGAYVYVAY